MKTIDLSKLRQSSNSFGFEATHIDGVLSFLRTVLYYQTIKKNHHLFEYVY